MSHDNPCEKHPDARWNESWGCETCFREEFPTQRDFDQRDDPRI